MSESEGQTEENLDTGEKGGMEVCEEKNGRSTATFHHHYTTPSRRGMRQAM